MNQPEISIRIWNSNDFKQVINILKESWSKAYSTFIPIDDLELYLNSVYSPEKLLELFNDKNIICFAAEVNGKTVGWLKLTIDTNENRFYLSSIYILPEYQKLKIGRQLMDIAFSEAKRNGFSEIWIGVMENNENALRWYQKMGFEFMKNLPFTMGKTSVNHFIGVKRDL